jgi:hypothetical protein
MLPALPRTELCSQRMAPWPTCYAQSNQTMSRVPQPLPTVAAAATLKDGGVAPDGPNPPPRSYHCCQRHQQNAHAAASDRCSGDSVRQRRACQPPPATGLPATVSSPALSRSSSTSPPLDANKLQLSASTTTPDATKHLDCAWRRRQRLEARLLSTCPRVELLTMPHPPLS